MTSILLGNAYMISIKKFCEIFGTGVKVFQCVYLFFITCMYIVLRD